MPIVSVGSLNAACMKLEINRDYGNIQDLFQQLSNANNNVENFEFLRNSRLVVNQLDFDKYELYFSRPTIALFKSRNYLADYRFVFHISEQGKSRTWLDGTIRMKWFSIAVVSLMWVCAFIQYMFSRDGGSLAFFLFAFLGTTIFLVFQYYAFKNELKNVVRNLQSADFSVGSIDTPKPKIKKTLYFSLFFVLTFPAMIFLSYATKNNVLKIAAVIASQVAFLGIMVCGFILVISVIRRFLK